MARLIIIAAICFAVASCSRFDASSMEDLLGNHSQDHPLNGTWQQLQSPEGPVNEIRFNRVPTPSNSRIGRFTGRVGEGDTVQVDLVWFSLPAFTFAGPLELSYDQGQLINPPIFGAEVSSACEFEVSADRTQLDFGPGCQLFRGSYTKEGQPLVYGDRLWR